MSGMAMCSWSRLSGLGGSYEEAIASDFVMASGPQIVQIAPDDVAFSSEGCGTWTLVE